MSEFLKFAFELIAQLIYNIAACFAALYQLFIGGWPEYILIFQSYYGEFGLLGKILSILLVAVLVAIPVGLVLLLIRRWILHIRLQSDRKNNVSLYKEIGRLNRQVLNLIDEKNKILAIKVNTMGGTERIPYMGASALAEDALPTLENVTGGTKTEGTGTGTGAGAAGIAAPERFPKLALVDLKYADYSEPEFDDAITLEQFAGNFRLYAASRMGLYYTPEIVRRFIAGMASSRILILEGISGTGKTSLPYSFSRYLNNPATMVSVQPSYRDRSELLGYFNEFSKRFNETEFLRALYEANYRKDPSMIVLDEMNLARIEYYFAEMLSVLEMPGEQEWVLDLVPTAWPKDPVKLENGKIHVPKSVWFVGTANNDDSTFTITDKVYDRAMPIELNERADAFSCEEQSDCRISCAHLEQLFARAKEEHPIQEDTLEKLAKLDHYLQTRFKLSFGNRILKQMYEFVPVYVACGGTELGGMDYIIARKVLKKFESQNVSFVRDEITGLIGYMEKTFGKANMQDSIMYLQRIQNFY